MVEYQSNKTKVPDNLYVYSVTEFFRVETFAMSLMV